MMRKQILLLILIGLLPNEFACVGNLYCEKTSDGHVVCAQVCVDEKNLTKNVISTENIPCIQEAYEINQKCIKSNIKNIFGFGTLKCVGELRTWASKNCGDKADAVVLSIWPKPYGLIQVNYKSYTNCILKCDGNLSECYKNCKLNMFKEEVNYEISKMNISLSSSEIENIAKEAYKIYDQCLYLEKNNEIYGCRNKADRYIIEVLKNISFTKQINKSNAKPIPYYHPLGGCADKAYYIYHNCTSQCEKGDQNCIEECKKKVDEWIKENCKNESFIPPKPPNPILFGKECSDRCFAQYHECIQTCDGPECRVKCKIEMYRCVKVCKINMTQTVLPKPVPVNINNCSYLCKLRYERCIISPMTQQCIRTPDGKVICSNQEKCKYFYELCLERCDRQTIVGSVKNETKYKAESNVTTYQLEEKQRVLLRYVSILEEYVNEIKINDDRVSVEIVSIMMSLEDIKEKIISAESYEDLKKIYPEIRKQIQKIKQEIKKLKVYDILMKVSEKIKNKNISEKIKKVAEMVLNGEIKPTKSDIISALKKELFKSGIN